MKQVQTVNETRPLCVMIKDKTKHKKLGIVTRKPVIFSIFIMSSIYQV